MSTDYTYDEQGQFFPYFVLVITSLVTLPTTYSLVRPSKDLENTAPRIQTDFQPEDAELIDGQKRKQKRKELKIKRMLTTLGGWLLMSYMVYLMIVTARSVPKIWDPYEVLGVSRSADERAIKSHWRRLSITHHPDKRQPDPSKNETYDSINQEWVDITKAFKTLTDEEIRNNYLQYGHPDGKQSFSIGIALPQFIITEGNGKYVLLLYGALLGVLLPYLVGRWWYGTQSVTKEKVLVSSAGKLFREYQEKIDVGGIIGALSAGDEYDAFLKGSRADAGLSTLEKRILAEGQTSRLTSGMFGKDLSKLKSIDEGARRKALGLLWAYLGRVELGDKTLNEEKYEVPPTALKLFESFLAISLVFANTKPVLSSLEACQHLIQAIPPRSSPLLQLPNMTPQAVQAVEGVETRKHLSLQQFMKVPDAQRRKQLVDSGILKASQYQAAMKAVAQVPALVVEKAFFKVQGEKHIIPNSLVELVVKARVIPPGTRNIPAVNEKDLLDKDKPETAKASQAEEEQKFQPPLAHAPYYARDHSPRWYLFLADSKQGKIAVPPPATPFSTFGKALFDDKGQPTFNMQTIKMQFGAPPQVGEYKFVMHLVCDSYIGLDTTMDVTLKVENASTAEEIDSEDEISEPDEDTIAGQMQALKGNTPASPKAKKPRRPRPVVEEEDSGSDTEGDEPDTESETDTDTDTDEE
ncbi:MAG: secretory subunit [Bogoriella megaspora]|nr:MAG: secretory subunit [Bogoriella megaspora]